MAKPSFSAQTVFPLPTCPICGESQNLYLFPIQQAPVVRCPGCGLISVNRRLDHGGMQAFHSAEPAGPAEGDRNQPWADKPTLEDAALRYLKILKESGVTSGRLLLVAPPGYPFKEAAVRQGYDVSLQVDTTRVENGEELGTGQYDAVISLYQLEKASDPEGFLLKIHAALRPGGFLLVAAPSLDNWPRRFFGSSWTEWRLENLHYFDHQTIQLLFLKCGFVGLWIEPDARLYTPQHLYERSLAFPNTTLTRMIAAIYRVTPKPLRQLRFRMTTSGMIITARKMEHQAPPLLSIILPAYNERETFATLMNALIEKRLEGIQREIIIVESNSTDGTRELVQSYEHLPEVSIIFQDKPYGKGHAVRSGLKAAHGDIIMIQDADLEYDLNDYDALLAPLLNHQSLFVLGARHGGAWKMRRYDDQRGLSTYLNFGQILFTFLINWLFHQKMNDPFTMYKLFRRDCIYGLDFECNRFDFDFELVIRLVRKGYHPLEIPVNYWSRSFKQGKKVRMFRDPLTWIRITLKLWLEPHTKRPAV